jgi:hypothetical protein
MIASHVAGDTLAYSVSLADYPASTWVLHYRLTPRFNGAAVTFDATASGDTHAVSVAAATTAGWVPGDYAVGAWVTSGTERYTVDSESGQITVKPNPATLTVGTDTRSPDAIALANITDVLNNRATSAVLEYEINGRSLRYIPHAELITLQSHYERRVKAAQGAADIAAGMGTSRGKVYVRMARA